MIRVIIVMMLAGPLLADDPKSIEVIAAVTTVEAWLAGGPAPANAAAIQSSLGKLKELPANVGRPLNERLVKALAATKLVIPTPTEKKPLREAEAADRLLLRISAQSLLTAAPEAMSPHRAATAFPGPVPGHTKRVTRTIALDITSKGYICDGVGVSAKTDIWHSTGLYAAPAETIRITVSAGVAEKKLGIRIGCHTDKLWNLKSWQRVPEISNRTAIAQATTAAANPFGGLVYITAPPGIELGNVEVKIENTVEAPFFQAGKTTAAEWSAAKKHGAPWAEFASKKIVLSLPAELARTVEDPGEVLAFWDKVLDCDAELTCVPKERGRAERFVHDVQISAGYMHSGYPIMCPLGEAARVVDVKRIEREGAWGYFHELGHNHQQRDWTFDGTVEVTCNLYSLYCYEKLCPNAPLHDSIRPEAIRRNAEKYIKDGKAYETWKKDPFTALIMYKQLRDEFGWKAFQKAFAKYQELNAKPRTDAARRDEWLVQMSQATGRNLGPFFESWGVPVSDAAKKKVSDLMAWMPEVK